MSEQECGRCVKQNFKSFEQAERVARRARLRGERVSAYPCPFQRGAWHVGHGAAKTTRQRKEA